MVLFGLLVEVVEGVMIVWPEVMYDAAEIWRISHGVVLDFSAANPEKIDLQSNCHVVGAA